MFLPSAEWTITGLVVERRVLRSEKNTDWSQPIVKLQTMGDTYEVACSKDLYDQVADGQLVKIHGDFDRRQGKNGGSHINFVGRQVVAVDAANSKAGAA